MAKQYGGRMTLPNGVVPQAEFRAQNIKREHSSVLSYGSAWQLDGWTDGSHVIELLWFGATHELVAYYITYDWAKLAPGKITRDTAAAEFESVAFDSGSGIGRELADADLATSEIDVEVLGTLSSDVACHELLWGWRWWQHHVDGLEHVRAQIRDKAS